MLALIELNFDPFLRIGEEAIRWQTIEVTIALLAGIGICALNAPGRWSERPLLGRRSGSTYDMVFILAGVVPGAVVGGRLVHVVVFWDAYAANPSSIFDPSVGSLSLLGAVIGGLFSGLYVASLIGAPLRQWADAAAVPLLVAIGFGKLGQLLGGSGQGLPFEGPWAVAFAGPGPWVSMNPELPSHPSQVYEALWVLAGVPIIFLLGRLRARRREPVEAGGLFLAALAWFFLGRLLVGVTWRDDDLVGPFSAEQLLAAVALVFTISTAIAIFRVRSQPDLSTSAP